MSSLTKEKGIILMSYNLSATSSIGVRSFTIVLKELGLPVPKSIGEAYVADAEMVRAWVRYNDTLYFQEGETTKVFTRAQVQFLCMMGTVMDNVLEWCVKKFPEQGYTVEDGVPEGYQACFF